MKEVWKEVKGYDGKYAVSNYGSVKTLSRIVSNGYNNRMTTERLLKPQQKKDRYFKISLRSNGKSISYRIHRLVYETFVGPIEDGKVIDHIDSNRENNRVDNLQAISQRLNIIKANITRHTTSIYPGVSYCNSTDRYLSCIEVNNKTVHLGLYESADDAFSTYKKELINYLDEDDYSKFNDLCAVYLHGIGSNP